MPKKIFKEVIGQDWDNSSHFFFRDDKIEEWIIENIPDKEKGKVVEIEVEFRLVEDIPKLSDEAPLKVIYIDDKKKRSKI